MDQNQEIQTINAQESSSETETKLYDSSPESIGQTSTDSWEKVQSADVSDGDTKNRASTGSSSLHGLRYSNPELIDMSSSTTEKSRRSSSSKGYTSCSDPDISTDAKYEECRSEYHSEHTEKNPRHLSFDPMKELENRIVKPLQRIFYRKRPVNEKSALVDNEVTAYDEDIIMPELPDPRTSYAQKQYNDLPEGIGTGTPNSPTKFNYSKLEDEQKKRASTNAEEAKGLLMSFLGAGVMYGLTAVFVRLAGEEGIDPIAVMFARSVFQAVVFGSTLLYKRVGWRPPPGRYIRCLWISVAYCIASISSYEAFDVIPPGSAVATRGAARTIFSIIFAYLVLREGVSIGDILGLLCCFGGITLIITSGMTSGDKDYIQPPGLDDNATLIRIYGYSLLAISAIGRSLGHVGVRGAREDLNTVTVVFYHSSLTILLAGILLATVRQPSFPPTWTGVVYVTVICVASSIATYTSNQAVKFAHPALVSFGQNADVIVSLTAEHILTRRSPRPMELAGVLTIFFGLCGLTLHKWLRSRKLERGQESLE